MSERIMAEMSCMPAPAYVRDSSEMYSFESKSLSAPSEDTWIVPFLEQAIVAIRNHPGLDITFDMLKDWGLPEEIFVALNTMMNDAILIAPRTHEQTQMPSAEAAISLTLVLLAAKRTASISRDDVRLVRKALNTFALDKRLETYVKDILDGF